MTEDCMELWSNNTLSEFVIIFNSDSVAKTSLEAKCTSNIDESPYREGYDNNWSYPLSQWVVFYLSNKYASLISTGNIAKHEEFRMEIDNDFYDNEINNVPPDLFIGQGPYRGNLILSQN